MPGTCPPTQAHSYCRREPEKHPLYQILAQHLETFLQSTRTAEQKLDVQQGRRRPRPQPKTGNHAWNVLDGLTILQKNWNAVYKMFKGETLNGMERNGKQWNGIERFGKERNGMEYN